MNVDPNSNCSICDATLFTDRLDESETRVIKLESGNMVHISCFKCEVCYDSLDLYNYVDHKNHLIHPKCYNGRVAPRCTVCTKRIKLNVSAVTLTNGNKIHKSCFKCTLCNLDLLSTFKDRAGKFYHSDCSLKVFGDYCTVCHLLIRSKSEYLNYNGADIHKNCFRCKECDVIIRHTVFTPIGIHDVKCLSCINDSICLNNQTPSHSMDKIDFETLNLSWDSRAFELNGISKEYNDLVLVNSDEIYRKSLE